MHHVMGAPNPADEGYQFQLVGNAVDGGRKWGMTIHDSHYGLVQDNVVYNLQTAGIVTEDGSESFDEFVHNFALHVPTGNGLWLNGTNGDSFVGNVAADTGAVNIIYDANVGSGFYLAPNIYPLGSYVDIPRFRGADMEDPAQVDHVPWSAT